MTPERFQQVQAIFLAALDRGPKERAAFLDRACSDDRDLRREVESLIAAHESSDPLLDRTVGAIAAQVLAQEQGETMVGQVVGAYRVERQIGRGGMGEVYMARDTRLDRPVAIKLLPASFNNDTDRVRRFQQEARAASLLNHPNIVTIHEIGEAAGRRFIVTEFVEGKTLRLLLRAGAVTPVRALDIVTQVASALNAAHQAGIIHRDIKPENVMVRDDGYVKVLDFGLAKLTGPAPGPQGESAGEPSTESGTVMGTVKYMSPEQARGQKVDPRTDIFSLGVVFYELLTGRAPFEGETPSHTIVAILEREPLPLTDYLPDATAQLRRIIEQALRKAREVRYQTVGEMYRDLLAARDEWQTRAQPAPAFAIGSAPSSAAARAAHARVTNPLADAFVVRSEATIALKTASDGPRVTAIRPRRRAGLAAVAALLALAAFGSAIYRWVSHKASPAAPSLGRMEVTRLTNSGNVSGIISPDGKYIAYMATEADGRRNLWVKQVVGDANLLILPLENNSLWSLAFSPDSNFLYLTLEDRNHRVGGALYKMPVLGGTPRKLLTQLAEVTNESFSPDGKRIVFPRGTALVIANADGSDEQPFITFPETSRIWGVAWSPDGQTIAYAMRDFADANGDYFYLAEKPVGGGAERLIIPRQRKIMRGLLWLPERSGLLTLASDAQADSYQLYFVPYPGGGLRRVTQDGNIYARLSATADRKTILLTQQERPADIWTAALNDPSHAKRVTPSLGPYGAAVWTPDGRLVYSQRVPNGFDIWIMAADGSHARQLTANAGANEMQSVTADGRYIVFSSDRGGYGQIWRMDIDGNNPRLLTAGSGWQPQCSPDGQWVIYQDQVAGQWGLWKVPMQGGSAMQIVDQVTGAGAISPDGRLLAYEYYNQEARKYQLAVRPFAGGQPVKVFDLEASGDWGILHWTHDGSALTYLKGKAIMLQPLGGAPRKLLESVDDLLWFDLSADGRQVVYTSGRVTTDMVMIRDAD
jgi:eukaryotic-like serine/threonine-protein kinase